MKKEYPCRTEELIEIYYSIAYWDINNVSDKPNMICSQFSSHEKAEKNAKHMVEKFPRYRYVIKEHINKSDVCIECGKDW